MGRLGEVDAGVWEADWAGFGSEKTEGADDSTRGTVAEPNHCSCCGVNQLEHGGPLCLSGFKAFRRNSLPPQCGQLRYPFVGSLVFFCGLA